MGRISTRQSCNRVTNLAWSMIIVAPMVVMFWRGIWDLLDLLIYPDEPDEKQNSKRKEKSGLTCVLVGLTIRIVLDLIKFHLGEFLNSKPGALSSTGRYVFTLVYAAAGVAFWRGVWEVMRFDVGERQLQLTIMLAGGVAVLIFSGISSSLISSPLAISVDNHENTFTVATFFQRTPDNKRWFVTDILFTNMIVRVLIVMCWWSLWSLESDFLIPNLIGIKDDTVATDSFLIGYTLTIIVAVLDRILLNYPFSKQYINKPLRGLLIVLAFIASVNVWRGVWSIYDNFLFPNVDHFLNYLVSALLAYLVLALFKVTNTICNDMIVWDPAVMEAPVIQVDYWNFGLAESKTDEMIPIVE